MYLVLYNVISCYILKYYLLRLLLIIISPKSSIQLFYFILFLRIFMELYCPYKLYKCEIRLSFFLCYWFYLIFFWFYNVTLCAFGCKCAFVSAKNSFMSLIIKKNKKKSLWLEIFNLAVSKANTTTVWHWNVLLSACYANLQSTYSQENQNGKLHRIQYTSHFYTFLVLVCRLINILSILIGFSYKAFIVSSVNTFYHVVLQIPPQKSSSIRTSKCTK